mgnify:CR=1 FL=1
MRNYTVTTDGVKVLLKEMRSHVKIYKEASETDRLSPSSKNNLEMVRWSLGAILTHLNDKSIREFLSPELIRNIASSWGAESKE